LPLAKAVQLRELKKILPLRVLSAGDWSHWQQWGYVIVQQAVPAAHCERLTRLLFEFQEVDPREPRTWNKAHADDVGLPRRLKDIGMVELYHHQYLWDNRQTPRIYDAFVDVWDREDLWVSIDRANLNPPNTEDRPFEGFLHWDFNTQQTPLPINVQGVLSLVDTDPDVGGFQCMPDLFHDFDQWRHQQPGDRDPFKPGATGFETRFVPMKAGDLLIWNSLLAHGIRPNRSRDRFRIAQYISMGPADRDNAVERDRRVTGWRERTSPVGEPFPGDPRGWERTRYPTARLTELGEKLLGLKSWDDHLS
jgi:hypothetical protein